MSEPGFGLTEISATHQCALYCNGGNELSVARELDSRSLAFADELRQFMQRWLAPSLRSGRRRTRQDKPQIGNMFLFLCLAAH